MDDYEWDESLATGDALVDQQHRNIHELLHYLEAALDPGSTLLPLHGERTYKNLNKGVVGWKAVSMLPIQQLMIGITGAFVGVIGWLCVGLYIQHRDARRRARNAGRAVYFELGANLLAIFMAREYQVFGPLSRATYDQLLPELATWLPADELQALALAYLGQGAYAQLAEQQDLPAEAREASLAALQEAHRVALDLLRRRLFTQEEIDSLDRHASAQQIQLIKAASRPRDA